MIKTMKNFLISVRHTARRKPHAAFHRSLSPLKTAFVLRKTSVFHFPPKYSGGIDILRKPGNLTFSLYRSQLNLLVLVVARKA